MVSLGDVTIREGNLNHPQGSASVIRGRKSSLPMIKGVNRNSLGLLIDQPEALASNLTPLNKRGMASLRGRNNSVQIHHATHTPGMISPGYASIVSSARREAKGLNFEIGAPLNNTIAASNKPSSIFSPARKRGSAALLYGRNQQLSRVKL